MYRQNRQPYLDRDGQVDQEWADEKWQRWSERDFHPAVEAYNDYNEPTPEMIVLKSLDEDLQKTEDALKKIQVRASQAQRNLELWLRSSSLHDSDHLLAEMNIELKNVFKDIDTHLGFVDQAQRNSKEQLKSLELVVKALLRSRTVAEKAKKKREAEDEKMIDTVRFLKECLNNHCRLVNLLLGKPEPLVQQGTDLIKAMLSEMFGLPTDESITEDSEVKLEPILVEVAETEIEAASEVGVFWEKTETEDVMDIDQDDEHEPNFNPCGKHPVKRLGKPGLGTPRKSKRFLQQERHEEERAALYERFGLSITSNSPADQERATGEERNKFKRQKTMTHTLNESPERTINLREKLPVLRQTTLSFDKVCKNRRLFSRKQLNQTLTLDGEEKKSDALSPGLVRRNPRRATVKRADYRDDFEAWDEKFFGAAGRS